MGKKIIDEEIFKKNRVYIILFIALAIILIIVESFFEKNAEKNKNLQDDDIAFNVLVINEIMTHNTGAYLDYDGNTSDWIELYNGSDKDIILTNYGLSDDEDGETKWLFPKDTVIKSKSYLVLNLVGKTKDEKNVNFSLSKKGGETITLKNAKGKVVDSIKTIELDKNGVMARDKDGKWIKTLEITPGYSNNESGRKEFIKSLEGSTEDIDITEFLPKNKGNYMVNGNLDEYVEIQNTSDKNIKLSDYYVSNDINVPFKWQLPDVTIKPDEIYLISSSNMNKNDEMNFHLDNKNGTLILSSKGKILEKIDYSDLKNGYAYINVSDNYIESVNISPGYKNDSTGINKFNIEKRKNNNDLIINEVMNYNTKYFKQNDEYYDWIELYNNSKETINLSDYYITNKDDKKDAYNLPDVKLNSGQYYILLASGNTKLSNDKYKHINFKLSSEESIYIYKKDKLVDSIFIADIPNEYSYGRGDNSGLYYFSEPTPGNKNNTSKVVLSFEPSFSVKPGIYNQESVNVAIVGIGDIYYTTDGSIPNKDSKKYNGPIKLDKTTVIRAISYENGKEASSVVTGSYIINENHTLSVMSLSLPDESYNNLIRELGSSLTVKAHAELFEKNSSFSIDCGMKLFGGQTRYIAKKSFALKFSSKYGQSKLKYKVFDNRDATKYDTIVVRSGSQDSEGAMFRDELATSIMNDYGTVDVQAYKPVILYINGKYWGIYFIREKVDEEFVSHHYNVSESGTNIVRIDNVLSAGSSKDYDNLISYVKSHDMTNNKNYEYVSERLDIDNFIDYLIGELYTTNNDIVNTRYFNNKQIENGKIKMVFYDFDYAFYNYDRDFMKWLTNANGLGEHHYNNTLIRGLMKNKKFKERFLERLSYNMKNVWSDKNVKARYDELYKLLEPEVSRNQSRWNRTYADWEKECKILMDYINKRRSYLLSSVKSYFGLSAEEMKKYFG